MNTTGDAELNDIAAPMARLESALERIAALTDGALNAPALDAIDNISVTARLDAMIARLRAVVDAT